MIVYISSGHWSAGMICLTHTVPNINDINSQKILSMPIYSIWCTEFNKDWKASEKFSLKARGMQHLLC